MSTEKLSTEQAVILSAYTGILMCPFHKMHEEVERRLGRPVFTHMFGNKVFVENTIKPAFKDDFLSMIPNDTERV